jgi:hypothetical protein
MFLQTAINRIHAVGHANEDASNKVGFRERAVTVWPGSSGLPLHNL